MNSGARSTKRGRFRRTGIGRLMSEPERPCGWCGPSLPVFLQAPRLTLMECRDLYCLGGNFLRGPNMSWLNNFKITFKVSLIVTLMGLVTIGMVIFAAQRMRLMDDANTDMVTRIDKSTTTAVRAARRAETYVSSAFQLLAETTDTGNAKLLAQAANSRKEFESRMAQVVKDMPEQAGLIEPVNADFERAFAACDPVIKFASTTTTIE